MVFHGMYRVFFDFECKSTAKKLHTYLHIDKKGTNFDTNFKTHSQTCFITYKYTRFYGKK